MVTSITIVLVLVPVILLLGRKSQLSRQTEVGNALQKLYQSTKNAPTKTYNSDSLVGLPEPVQRYFKYALSEGQQYVTRVKLKHRGWFRTKPKQKWNRIRGEEYFACYPPGFLWMGKLSWASAVDQYIHGRGNLRVKLLSLLPVVNAKGAATDQGEFLRWLAEAVWFPTALLPSENLSWVPIDEESARIQYQDEHIQAEGIFYFNDQGQITHFKTKRYMDDNRLEEWTTYCEDYRLTKGMRIPYFATAVWNLSEGDFCYAKFKLEEISYEGGTIHFKQNTLTH